MDGHAQRAGSHLVEICIEPTVVHPVYNGAPAVVKKIVGTDTLKSLKRISPAPTDRATSQDWVRTYTIKIVIGVDNTRQEMDLSSERDRVSFGCVKEAHHESVICGGIAVDSH